MTDKKKAAVPAYFLKYKDGETLDGSIKFTEWHHGHGVLDRYSIAAVRSDICDPQTLEFRPPFDETYINDLAKYWSNRGADVTKVTEAEADRIRDRLQKNPKGHLPKPKTEKAAPAKSKKTGGKTGASVPPHQRAKG